MSKNANLYIRIDQDIKTEAEQLFSKFGITITDAVNMFLHKAVMIGGLPFDLKIQNVDPFYSEANMDRLLKAIADVESGKSKLTAHELIEVEIEKNK